MSQESPHFGMYTFLSYHACDNQLSQMYTICLPVPQFDLVILVQVSLSSLLLSGSSLFSLSDGDDAGRCGDRLLWPTCGPLIMTWEHQTAFAVWFLDSFDSLQAGPQIWGGVGGGAGGGGGGGGQGSDLRRRRRSRCMRRRRRRGSGQLGVDQKGQQTLKRVTNLIHPTYTPSCMHFLSPLSLSFSLFLLLTPV